MILLLLACTVPEPKDTSAVDTGEPVVAGACTSWLPYDLAGTVWTYVDDAGTPVQTHTALGARDWEHGTAFAVAIEYSQDGEVYYAATDFFTCEAEGLALAGSEMVDGELRYVTFVDPPALWLPTDLTVGSAWANDSESVTETYDADGVQTDRAGGFVSFEAEVVGEVEATVPAGTFDGIAVLFGGEATMTFARDVGMVSVEQSGGGMMLGSHTGP